MRAKRLAALGISWTTGSTGGPSTGSRERNKEGEMSDFPGKILLATDGFEDAMLAARAAISLVGDTGAELHVVHVEPAHVYPLGRPVPLCPWEPTRR